MTRTTNISNKFPWSQKCSSHVRTTVYEHEKQIKKKKKKKKKKNKQKTWNV